MTTETRTKLTKRDYEKALQAYDGACNIRALAKSLADVLAVISNTSSSSDETAKHPITRLYLAQMSFLAGIGIGECGNADLEVEKILANWVDSQ